MDAAIAASKAALLATIIKHRATSTPLAALRYDPSKLFSIRTASPLVEPVFAKLAQISPEAFHYWQLVDQIQA